MHYPSEEFPQDVQTTICDDRRSKAGRSLRIVGLSVVALFVFCSTGWIIRAQETGDPPKAVQLLKKGEFPKGWFFYSAEKAAKIGDTWKLQNGQANGEVVLVCVGKPFGYLRTVEVYENFEFGLEWKYKDDPNGNSGVLIHTTEADKIWPKSIQIQLHGPKAGSIFPSSDAKTDNTLDVKDLSRPIGQWNSCVITSVDGKVSVVINGKKAGEVTGCLPKNGTIALQSEGSEVHFRNIWVRKMK